MTELYRIIDNGNTYVLLADLENPKKFCIKKVINKNGKEFALKSLAFKHYYVKFSLEKQ